MEYGDLHERIKFSLQRSTGSRPVALAPAASLSFLKRPVRGCLKNSVIGHTQRTSALWASSRRSKDRYVLGLKKSVFGFSLKLLMEYGDLHESQVGDLPEVGRQILKLGPCILIGRVVIHF
jgi:hypothetical protein